MSQESIKAQQLAAAARALGCNPASAPIKAVEVVRELNEARAQVERLRVLLAAANARITALTGEIPFFPE